MDHWYWKASKAIAPTIIALAKEDNDMIHKACKLSKKCGGDSRKVITTRSLGVLSCVGFVFKEPPDEKTWKKIKGQPDGYCPKASNRELRAEFEGLRSKSQSNVESLVMPKKSRTMVFRNGGLHIPHVGYV